MEVVGQRVVTSGDEVNLVAHLVGDVTRNLDDERTVGNEARIQNGLLVVEVNLLDATQVVTYDAELCLRHGLHKQRVAGAGLGRTNVLNGGQTAGRLILVGLVVLA